uniref:Fibronectin type-III domain-containing protein n=1 Tax=Panagrellus redivivus TaxID=6233 RepID=A0A7E4VUC0_PANRE
MLLLSSGVKLFVIHVVNAESAAVRSKKVPIAIRTLGYYHSTNPTSKLYDDDALLMTASMMLPKLSGAFPMAHPTVTAIHRHRRENNEIYEIRIYDSAAPGTKATLNEAFERVLRQSKNCFAQLDTDVEWIEFDSDRMIFLTTVDIPPAHSLTQPAILHLMCTSHKVQSINFLIHVTRRNRHPPRFSRTENTFYVPSVLKPGFEVGKLTIIDHDPIIYNSQIGLSILGDEDHFLSDKNGSIMIKKSMTDLQLYKPIELRVLAIDYGSPQLYSTTNITIIPVSVSQPANVRVNVANTEYQIFEWDAPEYGIAEKYKLTVKRRDITILEHEIDGQDTISLSQDKFSAGSDYTITVTALDVEGETPSEEHKFIVSKDEIHCSGECDKGGLPMCYYGKFNKIEQYRDKTGLHCLCFDGYSGPQCDIVESCHGEHGQEAFGAVQWSDAPVNESAFISCPYNSDDTKLQRQCVWDDKHRHAVWENVSTSDVCKKQSSILVHLGVLANYAMKEPQTVSGIMAVQRFLDTIMTFPAFDPTKITVQTYDSTIAEHAAQVMDTVISRNLSLIPGNISNVQHHLDRYIHQFVSRMPVPFTLESSKEGIQFKTFEWHAGLDTFPTNVGRRCYVHLPKSIQTDVVRVVCMRNTTLYPILTGDTPVMSLEMDKDTPLPPGSKALIGLRPQHKNVNYTCAHFDEKENGWSIAGVTVISRNFNNGFVLCETTHLSLFTLLPESLFVRKTDWFSLLGSNVVTFTTSISIIVVFLCIILIVCPSNHTVDTSLVMFLSTLLLMHFVHLVIVVVPKYIPLHSYDLHIYALLEYCILSMILLLAILNVNIELKVKQLVTDFNNPYDPRPRHSFLKSFVACVIPVALTFLSVYFNGVLINHVTSKKPTLLAANIAFFSTFAVPFGVLFFVTVSYATHSMCLARKGLKKTPRWADDREAIMRELSSAAAASLLVTLILFTDAFLFFVKTTMMRNIIIAITQIALDAALFIFTCYFCSLHFGSSSASTESDFTGNTLSTDRRNQDLSRDRLLDNSDKSASASPGNATLHGFRANGTMNNGYSTQNSVTSAYSSFKPPVDSIYIDEPEHTGPLVSIV